MSRGIGKVPADIAAGDWMSFPGGELEGKRPKAMCPACREGLARAAHGRRRRSAQPNASRTLCFQCYRAEMDRQRAIAAAANVDTGSSTRFQVQLPFEPVNRARLDALKAVRGEARAAAQAGVGRFADKRRQAQMAARHTLQRLADGLTARNTPPAAVARAMDAAIHAAELQLPDAWLPFVVSR